MRKRLVINTLIAGLISLLCGLFLDLSAQSRPREKEQLLSKDSILIGDQIVWSKDFTLKEIADYLVIPYSEILGHDTTINGKVEVVEEMQIEELSVKDAIKTLRAKMLLTSFDSGSYTLPSPIVVYRLSDGSVDTLSLGTTDLYVNNLGIDTTSFVPYDIKGQAKYPFSFMSLLSWLIPIILGIALIIALLWYLKYRRDLLSGKYTDPPHIVALKKLEKLRNEKSWQSAGVKSYYSAITDTLKEYIEKRYGIGAVEMTSNEIIEGLKEESIENKLFNQFSDMLSLADLVKFAKHSPSITENENSLHTAINFVNYSYLKQIEDEKTNEQENSGVDFYVDKKLKNEQDIKDAESEILNYKKEE